MRSPSWRPTKGATTEAAIASDLSKRRTVEVWHRADWASDSYKVAVSSAYGGVVDTTPVRTDYLFTGYDGKPYMGCGPSNVYQPANGYDQTAIDAARTTSQGCGPLSLDSGAELDMGRARSAKRSAISLGS